MKKNQILCIFLLIPAVFLLNSCKKSDTSSAITDKDGNTYTSVTIDTQTWMVENLKTTKYSDGSPIPLITTLSGWSGLQTPGCCFYDNDESTYKADYGALYNWFALDGKSNGNKNICPTGWHVPDNSDWATLITYLGGESVAGGKMKEKGVTHWKSPNTGATNESGFKALPGGEPMPPLWFANIGGMGEWWSSTESNYLDGNYLYITFDNNIIIRSSIYKNGGFSVRCIKN
jgi:uncharacterized protein (TIGR02145 family)